jgi:hypothetical protein
MIRPILFAFEQTDSHSDAESVEVTRWFNSTEAFAQLRWAAQSASGVNASRLYQHAPRWERPNIMAGVTVISGMAEL